MDRQGRKTDITPAGFRMTRGGRAFSPWVSELGLPIFAPSSFDLEGAYETAIQRCDDHLGEEDSAPTPPSPASPPVSGSRAIDPVPDQDVLDAFHLLDSTYASKPSPPSATRSGSSNGRSRAKKSSHTRRRAKRLAAAEAEGRGGSKPVKRATINRWKAANALPAGEDPSHDDPESLKVVLEQDNSLIRTSGAEPIQTELSLNMEDVRVASTGFVGVRVKQTPQDVRPTSKDEFKARGLDYVEWDGRCCRPILSRSAHVIGALAGCPRDDSWEEVNQQLISIFELVDKHYRFSKSQREHRRGAFNAVACGISYGGGQQRVANLTHTAHNQAVLNAAMRSRAVHRVANFGSAIMRLLAPSMFEAYEGVLGEVCSHDPSLQRNFAGNPFAAATLNVGRQSVAYAHTDHLNVPTGWCTITAIGNFDPKLGGHLVLWDLKLVIEFPPGSTILIPSALLKHSNTRLNDPANEFRQSFVQYTAGGIFRWVECGHRSQKEFQSAGRQFKESGKQRWQRGLEFFSKWTDLFAE